MIYTSDESGTPIFISGEAGAEINARLDALEAGSGGSGNSEKTFITVGKNDSTADYNTADYSNDMLAISNAITYAIANNFTKVFIKKGNYIYNSNSATIQLVSNFLICGEKGTKITGSKNAGWIFRNNSTNGGTVVENCIIKDIDFDLQNVANGSAIAFLDSRNSGTINCNYVNGGAGGWFIKFGTEPSTTSTFFGDNNFVLDSKWKNHAGSLEMLLIYNQKNFYGENWTYEDKTGSNPVFGLWQNTENTRIRNLIVRNCDGFNYYSNSTNNTFIDNFYVENSGCALQGANVSDNLIFGPIGGIQRAVGLYVNNFVGVGGANSVNSSAIELGAIQDYNIDVKLITGYQRGFTFSKGNNSNNANAKYGTIKVGTIKNLNPGNLNYDLSAPFVFIKGGSYHLRVEGGNIYDERTTPLMIQPIFYEWDGDSTPFSNITFEGGDYRSYLDRPTFRKNSNVTLESSVRMESMKNPVKGSFSSYYYDYADAVNVEVENLYSTLSTNTNVNRDDAKRHYYTITANIDLILLEPTEKRAGDVLHLTLIQDSTGFRTVNFKNNYQGTITDINFDELSIQPSKETKIDLIYLNNTWVIKEARNGAVTNFNDFNLGFGDLTTGSTPSGGVSTITNSSAPYQGYNGALFLATGTTSNGTASRRSELITVLRDNKTIFECIFRFPIINNGTDDFYSIIGFANSLSNPSIGAYLQYTNTNNNFELVTKNTAGTTTTDTNISVNANTDYKLRLVIDSLNSFCKCYINDVLVVTNTTNIPNASTGAENRLNLQISKLSGTNTRYIIFDYLLIKLMKIN
jgi:hypothetical protein